MNKCVLRSATVFCFPTLTGESCYLNFGVNTKFEFNYEKNGKITLHRKNIGFSVSKLDFEKLFKII